jgi:hypothetical protein
VLTASAAVGLAVSYVVTWDLWIGRSQPPNFDVIEGFSGFAWALPLAVTALVAAVWPRTGTPIHLVVLAAAILGDQIRLQPEFISLAILLVAGTWLPVGLVVGRWHLTALWGWAGLNKILSTGWAGGAAFVGDAYGWDVLTDITVVVVPFLEIGLAALALWPRAWRGVQVGGPLFQLAILVTLIVADWNSAVWAWNVVLAIAAFALFQRSLLDDGIPAQQSRVSVALAALFLVVPVGFYLGVVDAYLAYNLYSSNDREVTICEGDSTADCRIAPYSTWESLDVPVPSEPRLFEAWFRSDCDPGETLRISAPATRLADDDVIVVGC